MWKLMWEKALQVRCPTCGARPGERCTNYRGGVQGEPHRARKRAAQEQAEETTR